MEKIKPFVLLQVAAVVALICTIIGTGDNLNATGKVVAFILALSCTLGAIVFELKAKSYKEFREKKNNPRDEQVKNYMKKYLERGGMSVIFTRKMSWATDTLETKARNRQLEIYMQAPNSTSKRLKDLGANIFYYGDVLNDSFNTRFTIIKARSSSAELAIGETINDVHRIHKFTDPRDPAFSLARDVLALAEKSIPSQSTVLSDEI